MKLSNQQIDALSAKVSKDRNDKYDAAIKQIMTEKGIVLATKELLKAYKKLSEEAAKLSEGPLQFAITCSSVSYYGNIDDKELFQKMLTKVAEKEYGTHPSISTWDIRNEIIMASIDAETLADLGKKLGTNL